MKNGFRYDGFEAEAGGGSFGQRSGELQYGVQSGNFGVYIAGHIYGSNGWRQFSPDTARQLYAAVSYHHDRVTLDVSFSGASNNLDGEGTTPVQSLAVNRSLDFTTPQNNINRVTVVDANAGFQVTDELSMQVNAYRREFHQHAINGNTTNYRACASGNGLLCQADGATEVTAANGLSIPDISLGGAVPIGEEDRETIHAVTMGGAAQMTDIEPMFGLTNHLVVGGTLDHAAINFQSTTEMGVINAALLVLPSRYFVSTPENTGFTATPVNLAARDDYYGVFATDTLNLTPALAVTVSGRYNIANIHLSDRLGTALSGNSVYRRFNPAIGATYALTSELTITTGM